MTDEKLKAIRERWDACNEGEVRASAGTERYRQWLVNVAADEQDLLAEVDALRRDAAASRNDMHVALEEVRRLAPENAALREITRAVAGGPLAYEGDAGENVLCLFCSGEEDYKQPKPEGSAYHPFRHEDSCPATKARKQLGEAQE